MMQAQRFNGVRVLLTAAGCAALLPLASCASTALDTEEAALLASREPMARAIFIRVECEGDDSLLTYGTSEEWMDDLTRVLRQDLRVSEALWNRRDEVPEEDADVRLDIRVTPVPAKQATVDSQGATLNTLAWVTVPLLPLWMEDVLVDPGIVLELEVRFQNDAREILKESRIDVGDVRTSMSDRYPFFSWPTLGAILLPTFVYRPDEPTEHLSRSIGERVRVEAATKIAEVVKPLRSAKELLQEIRIRQTEDGALLSFEAAPEVGRLTLWSGKKGGELLEDAGLALRRDRPEPFEYKLPAHARLIRIEARSFDGTIRPYTIRVPGGDGGEDA